MNSSMKGKLMKGNIISMTYKKYSKLNIDTAPLGIELRENENSYFCTPKGAKIIGWAGVDGIHYCFVRGFGEMVFAVSPMNTRENYVHPIAKDFRDFLRLLLTCGNTAALEQVYCWDQLQFDAFLKDNPPSAEQQSVLDTIREKLLLTPMEQPFTYIKELQALFDYTRIKFTEDYYDFIPPEPKLPEWKVYFDGNFWGHDGRERAGKEIPIKKQFIWGGKVWHIPAIYACSKGLVVDFCVQIPVDCIQAFMDKWNLSIENDGSNFTNEQRMWIDAENPLSINMSPEVILNGKVLTSSHGCGLPWNPCFPEYNGIEAKGVLEQYGLDSTCGWAIWRSVFPWATKRKPSLIATLSVTLKQDFVAIPGPHFHVSAPGDCIEFTHPTTGVQHTLTVQEYKLQEMPTKLFDDKNYEYPTHYTAMKYTLSPDLPGNTFTVNDCEQSDRPKQKQVDSNEPQCSASRAAIGATGETDGPTAIFCVATAQGKPRVVCSALHFDPVDDVEWQMVFYKKTCEDITVILM